MSVTIFDLMAECRNSFLWEVRRGSFRVDPDGSLSPGGLPGRAAIRLRCDQTGEQCWITDERGRLPESAAGDYTGELRISRPPDAFWRLAGEISAWAEAHPRTDIREESLGEYHYARFDAPGGQCWSSVFARRLAPWRTLLPEVLRPC